MTSKVYNLGELEHIHNSQNLKLRTNVFITLYSCESFPLLSSNQIGLETLISSGVWIAGGNRVQFHVQFLFDDIVISDVAGGDVVEDIGVMLCGADIWSQLHLDASLSLVESIKDHAGHCNQFLLCLTRIPSDNQDIRPQEGVPYGCLEAVRLVLIFSTCRRTRVPLKTRGQNEVEKIGCEQQNSWVYHATRDEVEQAWDYGQPSQDWSSLDIEAEYNRQSWGSDQEHDRPGMQPISDMGQFATSTPTSSQYSNSSAHSLCSARNSSQPSTKIMPQYKFVPHDVNFENVLRMMSDSLSIVICDRRPRKSGGIVLSNDTGFPRLDTISPVLFSPGYLRALSSRNDLLPNIAHSLGGISRRTGSIGLKQKLELLQQRMPNVCLGDRASTFDEQEANGSTQPGIQARLWSLLQHRMIDAQAWPRWSPDILNVSMLARRASLGLYILDDPSLNAITKPDLTNVEFDNVPEARDIMLDDILDFDDDFLDNGDAADGQCLQDLRMNGDFVIEDDRLDEDLFWAELDVDADEDPPIGTLSQDTLESSGNEERYEVQREREEDDESRHDDLFGDHFRVDTDNLPSLQASTEGIGRPESWEVGFDELPTCEVDVLLDDEESAALDDSTFESNLGDESYNKILHKPLDGIRDENHYDNESFGEIMMDSDAEKVRDPAMLV